MTAGRQVRMVLLVLAGAALGIASAFFSYYTLRLAYVNLAWPGAASPRQLGMYIGAAAFPVAAVAFGWLARRCFKAART